MKANSIIQTTSLGNDFYSKVNKPDIIFFDTESDCKLEDKFLDKIENKCIVVIYVSSDVKFALNAYQNKAFDFVLKPFKIDSVIIAFNRAVKRIEDNRF